MKYAALTLRRRAWFSGMFVALQVFVTLCAAVVAPVALWFVLPVCVTSLILLLWPVPVDRPHTVEPATTNISRAQSSTIERLAKWMDSIDLAASDVPEPPAGTSRPDTALDLSVNRLVSRVEKYRDQLLLRHQRMQRLLRNVTDVLFTIDHHGHITWMTESCQEMLGYMPSELTGHPLRELLLNPDTDLPTLLDSRQLKRVPMRVRRKDNSIAWLLISSRRAEDADGRLQSIECICRDGTRLIEIQQALNREKERAQVALNAIGDGVITTDADSRVDYLNPRALAMLGVSWAQAIGQPFDTLCKLIQAVDGQQLTGMIEDCLTLGETRIWEDNLNLHHRGSGDQRPSVKVTISPLRNEQRETVGAVVALHDITRLQQISDEMSYLANHDMVTTLPNRRAFETRLAKVQAGAADADQQHALCYIDLDQFKLVNDTCGHDAGDEMLRQIANLLRTRLRGSDTVARLGGDEFGVIMEHLPMAAARTKAEKLRSDIDTFRFHWQDKLFRLGASIGLSAIDGSAVSVTELLRRADTACYLAKEKGRNQIHVYSGDSDEAQTRHGEMQRMQQINDALENDRFTLYAQIIEPLDPLHEHQVGAELLLRVRTPEGEILSPQNFLITAERYHAAVRIDRWVLAHALALIEAHGHHGGRIDHYSINISGQSITDESFVGFALACISNSAVDPQRLVFEITETTAVTNTLKAGELIRSLRALGCRFSLDDFGSGLSSFSYLKDLPSDFIKIDGKLVRDILHDPIEASIVQAINQVGQAMGLRTVAEQVETRAVLDALRRMGINYAQGYHVARPVPFAELAALLDQRDAAAIV